MIPDPITTAEAALILGVSRRHVQHLVATGQLAGRAVGRAFLVSRRAAGKYKRKPRGRRAK